MDQSFKSMKSVSPSELKERVETIKDVSQNDTEAYEVIRDRVTGEQYLHYAYLHINFTSEGEKEVFHHLLPLENDQVLDIIINGELYNYPENWQTPYLRSGPEGSLVWFDPTDLKEDQEEEKTALEIQKKLEEYKAKGNLDDDSLKKMLEEIENLWKK
ncbi:hypothetical protein [Ammoniphilus resinae]|uniref:Uncharacterized protein n=1 Tax=Ammoniphilus resinae TaxID=861532 RepID=A0ABS4GS88_9BACL|nr:hypothetical protein [Ammoniphilus resinae]MBP1932710.1 hypothetical protein [Ammoniphilus resinae]